MYMPCVLIFWMPSSRQHDCWNKIFCRPWNPLTKICTVAIKWTAFEETFKTTDNYQRHIRNTCPNSAVSTRRRSVSTFSSLYVHLLLKGAALFEFSCKVSYSFSGTWAAPFSRAKRQWESWSQWFSQNAATSQLQCTNDAHSQNMQLPRSFTKASWEVGDVTRLVMWQQWVNCKLLYLSYLWIAPLVHSLVEVMTCYMPN